MSTIKKLKIIIKLNNKKFLICQKHNMLIKSFCKQCNKNLCSKCEKEHKEYNKNIIYLKK